MKETKLLSYLRSEIKVLRDVFEKNEVNSFSNSSSYTFQGSKIAYHVSLSDIFKLFGEFVLMKINRNELLYLLNYIDLQDEFWTYDLGLKEELELLILQIELSISINKQE